MLLHDLGGQVLVSTPSYALVIAQAVRDAGIDPERLPLRLGLFGGEPWTEGMRAELERELGLSAVNFYGLSEMCGPGVAVECLAARDGLHVQEDHFLAEVVDPDSGRPLSPGDEGELVFTTLTKEALPLIRYRTGDIGSLAVERCACGRTLARLHSLRGRRDDMLIVRGVNLFPSHVEHLLLGVEEVAPHYRLVVERPGRMDELTVECEPAADGVDAGELGARLELLLRDHTGIRIAVAVVEPGRCRAARARRCGWWTGARRRPLRLTPRPVMDWKLELVQVPVSDVDRAMAFYPEQVGFNLDHDHQVSDDLRFVQLTPPGSGCSIAIGAADRMGGAPSRACSWSSPTSRPPRRARRPRPGCRRDPGLPVGNVIFFSDPDGNRWAVQQNPVLGDAASPVARPFSSRGTGHFNPLVPLIDAVPARRARGARGRAPAAGGGRGARRLSVLGGRGAARGRARRGLGRVPTVSPEERTRS